MISDEIILEIVKRYGKKSEEEMKEKLREKLSSLSDSELLELTKVVHAERARNEFGVGGFDSFYFLMTGYRLAPYARDVWAPAVFRAIKERRGVLIEGFRGATKSSFLFWLILFVTGHRPWGSSVLARISDQAAQETGKAIASIIELSPEWKMVFPHVEPVKARWSTEGYYVRDTRVKDEGEWIRRCIADHLGEPSILTAGITSGVHIGKHPTNGFFFDDFHDENNTRSVAEMSRIVAVLESNIIPTWNRPMHGHPALIGVCTMWDERDGYHALLRTGLFEHIRTPIMEICPCGDGSCGKCVMYDGEIYGGQWVRLAWPEGFPVSKIRELERRDPVHFARNFLCDLTMEGGLVMKREWLRRVPSTDISGDVIFGVDFASVGETGTSRDYFAIAVAIATRDNRLIVVDGARKKLNSFDAIRELEIIAARYPDLKIVGVEKYGKGEEFVNMIKERTKLPVVSLPVYGQKYARPKGERFSELASAFYSGKMAIAEEINRDFLDSFEAEWIGWDGRRSRTGHDDCLDAVYYCYDAWRSGVVHSVDVSAIEFWRG